MAVDDVYTKLLLHMEGADNGTAIVDEAGHAVTVIGDTCTKTENKKFGTSSLSLGETSSGSISFPSADFNFGAGSFTIDTWVYLKTLPTSDSWPGFFTLYFNGIETGSSAQTRLHIGSTALQYCHGSDSAALSVAHGFVINTWYHVALVRSGTTFMLFINGVLKGSATITTDVPFYSGNVIRIGCEENNNQGFFHGKIDEYRISKGIARWTANFTPQNTPYAANFKLSGNAVFGPYILPEMLAAPASSTIAWSEDVPEGTSLTLKAAIVSTIPIETDYLVATNGAAIPGLTLDSSGKNLYIKAYLTTTDVTKTPKLLTSPQYVITEEPDAKAVQLDLSEVGRIKAPIDNIVNVGFTGLLSGLGGSNVDPFSLSFSPTDIILYFNPNDAEHLSVTLLPTVTVTDINYISAQTSAEYLTAQISEISIVVTLIGSIPL